VITSRDVLDQNIIALENRFHGREVPRPPHWGGYRVKPEQVEFWQGRQSRLHDRILYTRVAAGWNIHRLAP
jgi:pyridoxamine 5'-phosphate oxidase